MTRVVTHNPQFWYNPNAIDAYWHAHMVIKARWTDGEPYIMQNPQVAYSYAYNVLKSRCVEFEPTIKGTYYQDLYEFTFKCKL